MRVALQKLIDLTKTQRKGFGVRLLGKESKAGSADCNNIDGRVLGFGKERLDGSLGWMNVSPQHCCLKLAMLLSDAVKAECYLLTLPVHVRIVLC
jgi:hypothetical protein